MRLASATEEVSIVAADGVRLRLSRRPALGDAPRAVCLLTHAMMASSRYFERGEGGFTAALAAVGVESWRLDFRGCGASRGGPAASFDDYVRLDLAAAVAEVARRAGVAPGQLGYLGHSLGGLVGVAGFATGAAPAPRRLVLAATQVWVGVRRLRDRAVVATWDVVSRLVGRVPARALRIGSEDPPGPYARDFVRWARGPRWDSAAGVDYRAAAGGLAMPTLVLAGTTDWMCPPAEAAHFAAALGGPRETVLVGGAGFSPDHFTLFSDPRAAGAWQRVAAFLAEA